MGFRDELPCSIRDVVDLLSIQVIRDTGTQLHCRCPFCDDRKAHLNVKLDKNVFRCNRCGEGGGVLHLYAAATNISMAAAYEELCRVFQSGEDIRRRKLNDTPRNQRIVTPEAELAPSNIRDNTYRNLLSLLTLGSMHRESLLMRGLSGDAIDQLGYRTTPAVRSGRIVAELLERGCELEGVPGFYRDRETGSWKLDIRASGIMIPDRNMLGEIEAIQIRLDRPYKSKFNNLTSVDKYYGTTASCCPHFAGPHDSDAVYLTEGVMKADIAQYLSNALAELELQIFHLRERFAGRKRFSLRNEDNTANDTPDNAASFEVDCGVGVIVVDELLSGPHPGVRVFFKLPDCNRPEEN